ncbi:hypothetical protein DEJ48_23300 [Streptomyces venezuelae]|uniref:Integral membrane protein n=1 Tax=Streptomyces venezuelae TaxID=54571 RepID=A0A5P2C142_STRVZ|nr:hypothetical protein [Streptomyces venezuelae]QES35950.1 hypothetical protein DEJ48_23300 [Streptomyces venezuelae]
MHGHGYAPQHPHPPSRGTHVTLRVLFVVLTVLTCGLLAWAAMLRLALVTRKAHNWVLFGIVTALDVLALALVGVDPGEDEFQGPGSAGMVVMLCTMVAAVAYYLYGDIRHFSPYRQQPQPQQPQQYTGYVPQQPQASYGYPQQIAPAPNPAPAPGPPGPVHLQPTQLGHTPPPHPPAPAPARPAPVRIDQVRAELDELSDYLRKQEGGN